jgi:hypothetical protein
MASTMLSLFFLTEMASSMPLRIPVTTMVSSCLLLRLCRAGGEQGHEAARGYGIDLEQIACPLEVFMLRTPKLWENNTRSPEPTSGTA